MFELYLGLSLVPGLLLRWPLWSAWPLLVSLGSTLAPWPMSKLYTFPFVGSW